MNIKSYLENPMGKGSSVMMVKTLQRELDEQFHLLQSSIILRWYKLQDQYYICHVKIPSRHIEGVTYDVLVQFDSGSIKEFDSTINNGDAKVFSNCPSFTYTYAYVFNQEDNIIPWCKSLYPKEVLSKRPQSRNPYELVSYERSLYLAFKYITTSGRNYKKQIDIQAVKINNWIKIKNVIRSSDDTIELYNKNKQKMKKEKKESKNLKNTSLNSKTPKSLKKDGYHLTKKVTTTKAKFNNGKRSSKIKKLRKI